MKKLRLALIIAAGFLILFFTTPLRDFLTPAFKHGALKRRQDLPTIALELATFLSEDPPRTLSPADPEFPESLRHLDAMRLQTGQNKVYLEFGGGFYHYGYLLERSDPDNPTELKLICYGEYEEDRDLLLEFTASTSPK